MFCRSFQEGPDTRNPLKSILSVTILVFAYVLTFSVFRRTGPVSSCRSAGTSPFFGHRLDLMRHSSDENLLVDSSTLFNLPTSEVS